MNKGVDSIEEDKGVGVIGDIEVEKRTQSKCGTRKAELLTCA